MNFLEGILPIVNCQLLIYNVIMPRKRKYRRRKKGLFYPISRDLEADLEVSPDTAREIIGVSLIVFGVVFFLSILNLAGNLGSLLYAISRIAFGWSSLFLPAIFIFLGVGFLYPQKFLIKPSSILGILIFIAASSALIHLIFAQSASLEQVKSGAGGGYVGYLVTFAFFKTLGFWASLVIFLGALVSSLLLAFNTSTSKLREKLEEIKEDKLKKPVVVVKEGEELKTDSKKSPQKEEAPSEVDFSFTSVEDKSWKSPPLELLSTATTSPDSGNVTENVKIIEKTLRNFGVSVDMVDVNIGPTVTQYTLKPATGVKLNKITALNNDLALALAAHPIRIEAPIPGKSLVGIEVPNKSVSIVRLRKLLEAEGFLKRKSNLTIVLGRDVAGSPMYANLDSMPHLLIAGSTGSGKSVSINSLIIGLLYQNSPRDLKLLLVDPKRVELPAYNGIPHLLTEVITDVDKTVNALKWTISEMDKRYKLFSEKGMRDIKSYNQFFKKEKMPYIVVIIDELADLMNIAASDVEGAIVRLSQMARATGIHLVVSTQRPSVDVITGLIKANITSRIAFAVASQVDSRTILDTAGAEKLLGKGDMLYLASDVSKPRRVQGVFIADDEINRVVNFLKGKEKVSYNDEILEKRIEESSVAPGIPDDPLYNEAVEVVVLAKKASASLLQRRLRVGYARAARLLDLLEERGVIAPQEGNKPRDVLISSLDVTQEPTVEADSKDEEEY